MNRRPRHGYTLIELTIAGGLLGVLFAALAQFVSRWDSARHAAHDRALALRAVENVLEYATIENADPKTLLTFADVESRLRSPELDIQQGTADELGLIPLTATLSWINAHGQRGVPVTLTAWKSSRPAPVEAAP